MSKRLLHNLPEDAPSWMMPYHLDHYGGFHREWQIYRTPENIPYWFSSAANKSTWDSPTMILTSLITNGVDSDTQHQVESWEGVEGTPFTLITFKKDKKTKTQKRVWIHRTTKQVFLQDPFAKAPEKEAYNREIDLINEEN